MRSDAQMTIRVLYWASISGFGFCIFGEAPDLVAESDKVNRIGWNPRTTCQMARSQKGSNFPRSSSLSGTRFVFQFVRRVLPDAIQFVPFRAGLELLFLGVEFFFE